MPCCHCPRCPGCPGCSAGVAAVCVWVWRAQANKKCEAFVVGPCNARDPVCGKWPVPTVNACYLVSGYRGLRPSADRATGVVRGPPLPPPGPPLPPSPPPAPPAPPGPAVTRGWGAGWGFVAHHGLPPMPTALQSRYFLNQSVIGMFVGNNTGLANPSELQAEAMLGIVGIGWNLNHLATSKTGGLER